MSDDRRSVKTYVPAEQKTRWQRHADELGMSQSEFVRTMVQAGRRGFTLPEASTTEEAHSGGSDPRGHGLETRIEAAIADGHSSWDDLVDAVFADFEDRLEETLDSLQERDRVRYSGRDGGYTLVDE
ncbi:DUF5805 domain-containing protein [Halorubrum rubrum]|uniref:DUF5805 domain-containing protein n=1 Tax=Halorubrum rubrum TaxID=1126240 RepID=A0ABD5R5J1_9EURY|nr:DUF5805 domain-containing protein [Halorubrum rubrum]